MLVCCNVSFAPSPLFFFFLHAARSNVGKGVVVALIVVVGNKLKV